MKSIPALLILVLGALWLTAPSAQAITRRADPECLLCHVLWFDTLKSDRQTLLRTEAAPIVVAGSTGLVSTEAMCVTCHDGYVADSRNVVQADNPHHKIKQLPESMGLPKLLRLDRNNEIYCGTCHTLHDFEESATVGSSPFMRMDNERSQMCVACHTDQAREKGGASHPVMKAVGQRARARAAGMGSKFSPDQELICQSCHIAHGQRAQVRPPQNSTLCVACHQDKGGLVNSKHDFRTLLPDMKNIKQQRPAQSGPCGACHVPHQAAGQKLWARRLDPGPAASQMCLSCHGDASGVDAKRIGQHSHPLNIKPGRGGSVPKVLPLYMADATKSSKGRVQCFTCHDVHRWNPTKAADRGKRKVEGDGSNSFLRLSNQGSSGLCVACHKDKSQVVASDHNLAVTAPQERNRLSKTAAQSGPCSACHVPHNAADRHMWAKEAISTVGPASDTCISCHRREGAAAGKLTGPFDHPVDVGLDRLAQGASEQQVQRTLPLFDTADAKGGPRKMTCRTCHDPHTWRPRPTGSKAAPHGSNVEGDATNSFLRTSNYPSPDLCATCHGHHSQVEGTAHDLKVSAPQAKNLAGQTVAASGTCGTCHLVHNSPNEIGLWARDYGPVSGDINKVGALCTSCHAKGRPAEKKIPAVASHPKGKLIRSHSGTARGKTGSTPVFDEAGRKQDVGNLGCPSCHDGHLRTTLSPPAGAPPAGDRSRFLRNRSFNTVCMECHGPEGLFRYLYFHDAEKRGIWTKPRQAHDRSRITPSR